jgi:hypothetical protein
VWGERAEKELSKAELLKQAEQVPCCPFARAYARKHAHSSPLRHAADGQRAFGPSEEGDPRLVILVAVHMATQLTPLSDASRLVQLAPGGPSGICLERS